MRRRSARLLLTLVALLVAGPAAQAQSPAPGLGLRGAALRADGGTLRWTLETAAPWADREVSPDGARRLCLVLWAGASSAPRSRLCVDGRGAGLTVQHERLAPDGTAIASAVLAAGVRRTGDRGVAVSFTRRALGVPYAVLFWRATARWGDCAPGCDDAVPATGKRTLDLRPPARTLAEQRTPRARPDSRDTPASPLDVRSVAFAQQDLRLVLRVRTQGAWRPADLGGDDRSLCLLLGRSTPPASGARL